MLHVPLIDDEYDCASDRRLRWGVLATTGPRGGAGAAAGSGGKGDWPSGDEGVCCCCCCCCCWNSWLPLLLRKVGGAGAGAPTIEAPWPAASAARATPRRSPRTSGVLAVAVAVVLRLLRLLAHHLVIVSCSRAIGGCIEIGTLLAGPSSADGESRDRLRGWLRQLGCHARATPARARTFAPKGTLTSARG